MKSLQQILHEAVNENFWQWFGNSVVVDNKGNPLVVHHGTDQQFTTFVNRSGLYFFTTDKDYALTGNHSAGPNRHVMEVYLRITNPKIVDSTTFTSNAALTSKKVERLKQQGYDGLVGKIGNYIFEYVVFSPTQIKSATDNNGNFDPNDPDITH